MLLKIKQVREGGTELKFNDGTEYHFRPNENGDHVAEVTDAAHLAQLLAISEGFEEYGEAKTEDGEAEDGGIDLGSMNKAALLAFAAEHGIALNDKAPVPVLRKQIAEALA